MVFPVVMYGYESWTMKKAECQRIDAFEQWCWRRHLRVPWTARRSNQSIIKEINPNYSLERLMLKLMLQNFGHVNIKLMWRAPSLVKDPDAGKNWRQEEKDTTEDEMVGWHHQLNGHQFQQALGDSEGQGNLECCSPWGHEVLDMTERLNDNEQQEVRGSMETVMQFIEASLWWQFICISRRLISLLVTSSGLQADLE